MSLGLPAAIAVEPIAPPSAGSSRLRVSAARRRMERAHRLHDAVVFPRRQTLDTAVAALDTRHSAARSGPPSTSLLAAARALSTRAAARAATRSASVPASISLWPNANAVAAAAADAQTNAFSDSCDGCRLRLRALVDRLLGPLAPLLARAQGGGLVHHICGPAGSGKSHAALQLLAVRAVLVAVNDHQLNRRIISKDGGASSPCVARLTSPVDAPAVLLAAEPVAASRLGDLIDGVIRACRDLKLFEPSSKSDEAQIAEAALSRIAIVQLRSVSHLLLSLEQLHRADVRLMADDGRQWRDRRRDRENNDESAGPVDTAVCGWCGAGHPQSIAKATSLTEDDPLANGFSRVIVLDSFAAAVQLPFAFGGNGDNGGDSAASDDDRAVGFGHRRGVSASTATAAAVALADKVHLPAELQGDDDGDDNGGDTNSAGRSREHKRAIHLFRRAGVVGFALRALASATGGATSVVVINQVRARPDAPTAAVAAETETSPAAAVAVMPLITFPTFEESAWCFSATTAAAAAAAFGGPKQAPLGDVTDQDEVGNLGRPSHLPPLPPPRCHGQQERETPMMASRSGPTYAFPYCVATYRHTTAVRARAGSVAGGATAGACPPVYPLLTPVNPPAVAAHASHHNDTTGNNNNNNNNNNNRAHHGNDGDGGNGERTSAMMGPTFGTALRPFIHGGCYVLRRVRSATTGAPLQASRPNVAASGSSAPAAVAWQILAPLSDVAGLERQKFPDGSGGMAVAAPVRCLHCVSSPWAVAAATSEGAAYCLDRDGFVWLKPRHLPPGHRLFSS